MGVLGCCVLARDVYSWNIEIQGASYQSIAPLNNVGDTASLTASPRSACRRLTAPCAPPRTRASPPAQRRPCPRWSQRRHAPPCSRTPGPRQTPCAQARAPARALERSQGRRAAHAEAHACRHRRAHVRPARAHAAPHAHPRPPHSPEVLRRRGQDLVPALLPLLVADAQQVAAERGVALGVGQLVCVDVADGADDGLARIRAGSSAGRAGRAWAGRSVRTGAREHGAAHARARPKCARTVRVVMHGAHAPTHAPPAPPPRTFVSSSCVRLSVLR